MQAVYLNEKTEAKNESLRRSIQSGWLIDIIAPFGGLDAILKELKSSVFAERTCRYMVPSETGGVELRELTEGPVT